MQQCRYLKLIINDNVHTYTEGAKIGCDGWSFNWTRLIVVLNYHANRQTISGHAWKACRQNASRRSFAFRGESSIVRLSKSSDLVVLTFLENENQTAFRGLGSAYGRGYWAIEGAIQPVGPTGVKGWLTYRIGSLFSRVLDLYRETIDQYPWLGCFTPVAWSWCGDSIDWMCHVNRRRRRVLQGYTGGNFG